jgi:hypothetical protein
MEPLISFLYYTHRFSSFLFYERKREIIMRAMAIILILIGFFTTTAEARKAKMRVGSDAFVFDLPMSGGQTLVIDVDFDAPGGEHDWYILEELLEGIDRAEMPRIGLGRARGIQNAYAFIWKRDNNRYIVSGPEWTASSHAFRFLVMGHELGHHMCGHQEGQFSGNAWEKELEADGYAGARARITGRESVQDLVAAASQYYSDQGSNTHPPKAMRLKAISDGYRQGSQCRYGKV